MSYTLGDERSLACPHCGHEHQFSDWLMDGWSGGEVECDGCQMVFEVEVDYSVNLRGVPLRTAAEGTCLQGLDPHEQ